MPERPLTRTPEETAEIIGGDVKVSWLKEKARKREIPFTFIGGKYSWTDAQIAEIVAGCAKPARPAPAATPAVRQPRTPADAAPPAGAVTLLRARQPKPYQRAS